MKNKNKFLPIISSVLITALLSFFLINLLFKNKNEQVLEFKKCTPQDEKSILEGYQCYFSGDGEEREGRVILNDFNYNDFIFSVSPHDGFIQKYNQITTGWKNISNSEISFKIPQESVYDEVSGSIVYPLSSSDGIPLVQIERFENNSVKMSEGFPKGCFASSLELAGETFEKFDCKNKLSISSDWTELFLQKENYYLHMRFSKTSSGLLDSYVEAILLSLKFNA